MAFIEMSPIIDWEEFVDKFKNYENNSNLIFRGQSNSTKRIDLVIKDEKTISKQLVEWKLESSFNRYYDAPDNYNFRTIISQQLQGNLFRDHYGQYELLKQIPLHTIDLLNKIYFLQHYGYPTCLIDFTTDPLIALYFSITSIKGSSGHNLDIENNISNFPDDCFLTLYQIDCSILREIGIKEVCPDNDLSLSYDNYEVRVAENRMDYAVVGLLNNPKFETINFNLEKQKGCFILYDNKYYKNKGLDEFLNEYVINNDHTGKNGIYIYRIRYNSIFKNRRKNKSGLFRFLMSKNIYGATLFNDMQGLKYDFNFFHQQ